MATIAAGQLSGLDYVFAFPWSAWIKGDYSAQYGNDIAVVYRRANYNASILNVIPFFQDYKLKDFEAVINAYGTAVLNGEIPEYDDTASADVKNKIYDVVSKNSGIYREFVKVVLYEAYWATYGKPVELFSNLLIKPKTWNEAEKAGKHAITAPQGPPSAFDDLRDTLKTIMILATIGVVAYGISSVAKTGVFSKK